MKYASPKGTFDILPTFCPHKEQWKALHRWQFVEQKMRDLACDYGYEEVRTPVFEQTDLFLREMGETSDIVSKEMYIFEDKGARSMTLRPEGTAPVMRAFVQNGLQQLGSFHKFFYIGPFFRYDRPQAGRFRQFHQFGIEAIGDKTPEQDFEVIDLLYELFRRLEIKGVTVLINTLGRPHCREAYKEALLAFLRPHFASLSSESQARFVKNPLRILDSKDPEERALLKEAPSILDFLDATSNTHFNTLCHLLTSAKIPFEISPHLVRGLDYYNQTVFEMISNDLGAQNTIGAGGRYDGLLQRIGGVDLPSIGFSVGIERLLQTMDKQNAFFPEKQGPLVALILLGEKAKSCGYELLYTLRHAEISTILMRPKTLSKGLSQANQAQARYSLIIGEKELDTHQAQVKDLKTGKTYSLSLSTIVQFFKGKDAK